MVARVAVDNKTSSGQQDQEQQWTAVDSSGQQWTTKARSVVDSKSRVSKRVGSNSSKKSSSKKSSKVRFSKVSNVRFSKLSKVSDSKLSKVSDSKLSKVSDSKLSKVSNSKLRFGGKSSKSRQVVQGMAACLALTTNLLTNLYPTNLLTTLIS